MIAFRSVWTGLILLLSLVGTTTFPDGDPVPVADHHIHVLSETASQHLRNTADLSVEAKDGDTVIQRLTEAGVEQGVLLSVAYMFGRPGTNVSNEYEKVRQENDFVAQQAAEYPDRLVAFCSVNPLADYAVEEIQRCNRKTHLSGLKLQLANSKVSLRDSAHVARLAEIFAIANRHGLPIVVHVWTGSDYKRSDVETFIQKVLPEASDVTVQVAHLGGKGMFGPSTAEAMTAFEAEIDEETETMDNVIFDLGAVTADPEAALAAGDTTRAAQYRNTHRQTARWIKRIGPDRVVFGSDYFARSIPDYVDTIRTLPAADSALRDIFDNPAPYLEESSR